MKAIQLTLLLIISSLLSCSQNNNVSKPVPADPVVPVTSVVPAAPSVDYIVFGTFCGECAHNCATMYRYNAKENAKVLMADRTDSFFKNYFKMTFESPIADTNNIAVAKKIIENIPDSLIYNPKPDVTFGCPDCSDGCGIYFELGRGTEIKRFRIDWAEKLPEGQIKKFAAYLKKEMANISDPQK